MEFVSCFSVGIQSQKFLYGKDASTDVQTLYPGHTGMDHGFSTTILAFHHHHQEQSWVWCHLYTLKS